jgi:hypothetical protein
LSGVARCWHSNAYFSLFSSLLFFDFHRTDLSRFRGTFHSFDPVGFAIFAMFRWSCPMCEGASEKRNEEYLRLKILTCMLPAL